MIIQSDHLSSRQREVELGNLAEEREAEDKDDSSEGNRHSGGEEDEGESSKGANGNKRNVARTFRYMRKRPTIIFYKPPEGEITKNGRREVGRIPGLNSVMKRYPSCSGH